MSAQVETLEFQAEARQLLQLMIHSVYTNKDVFLRELISNASDALDKLRLESLIDKELQVDTSDLHIDIEIDRAGRLLTVRDNGTGMSRQDVIALIGTIAKSGTAEFVGRMKESNGDGESQDLIGQFGVGFYSSFMVADKVTLLTRAAAQTQGTRWESAGDGTYTLEEVEGAPQGTSVTLALKPEDADNHLFDYASDWKIKELVKRYSDFITWPIRMQAQTPRRPEDLDEAVVDDAKTVVDEAPYETVNSMKALWARSKDEVSDDEYNEFYKSLTHDWTNPLETILLRAEGTFEYQALLFIPSRAPMSLFARDHRSGVQLYVKRVHIMDNCEALMPDYLRFVAGVVDAQDLSLNVSRELLQQDRQIQRVQRRLVKKILSTVKTMMTTEPDTYRTFWTQFGRALKEGLLSDFDNRESLLDIVSFESTHDAEQLTTLRQYRERANDGHQHIYYMTGESRSTVENSPHLEAFRAKGIEVLILTDPIDEIWVDAVGEFDGTTLRSVAKGEVDLDAAESKDSDDGVEEQQQKDFSDLLTWMSSTLDGEVKQVRLSTRLTTSPACLVGDAHDLTPTLERMYRASGQSVPTVKRILELNPGHPLIIELRNAREADADDEALAPTAELLYGMALLAEGGELREPARFTRLLAERLTTTLTDHR